MSKIEKRTSIIQKTAIIYARVSTQMQSDAGFSLDSQIDICKNFCKLYQYKVKGVYKDEGITGTSLDRRAGMKNALQSLEDGDTLVIYSISRLSRNVRDFSNIVHDLKKQNKNLISVSENINSSDIQGNLMLNILGSLAEWESQMIGKRVSDTMSNMKNNGRYLSKPPYGYKINPDKKGEYLEDVYEQEIIKFIFDLHNVGMKISKIVIQLNTSGYKKRNGKNWDYKTTQNIIKNYESNVERVKTNNDLIN